MKVPVFSDVKNVLFTLSTEDNFSGYFLCMPQSWRRRSDGPGANVNLRNLWLTPALSVVFPVSIVFPRTFLISLLN
ncbi:MAG TPA: hypothetical protein DDY57_05015 [Franconibacter pulveris]|nr:hypothetical protein [Franconibacter pulveris]